MHQTRPAFARARKAFITAIAALGLMSATQAYSQMNMVVHPGEPWHDDRGREIEAHGGGIIKVGDTWYWFGEDRSQDNDRLKRYVSCYASKDLMNWQFRNQVVAMTCPSDVGPGPGFVLERPKVYPLKNGKYVMYIHLDSSNYSAARVGVLTCDRVDGNYQYVKSYRPLDQESRDIGQFIDDDGTGYLIFESRPTRGFFIAKLNDDGMDVTKTAFIKARFEGGALCHYNGLYYLAGSWMSGWAPNANQFGTATTLAGFDGKAEPDFHDIAPPATKTYGGQSSMLLKVTGTKTTSVIFMADIWKPRTQWDSRYLWMPAQIGDGKLWIPTPKPWSINVKTGEVQMGE